MYQDFKTIIKKNKINVIDAALFYELKIHKLKPKIIKVVGKYRSMFSKRQKYVRPVKKYDFKVNNNKNLAHLKKQVERIMEEL